MPPKQSTIEDTINNYRNKFQIDLEDEVEETFIELQRAPVTYFESESISAIRDQQIELKRGLTHEDSDTDDNDDSGRIRKSKLPRDLSGLMGQANLSFARSDTKDAIFMCQEVIRLAPNCPDPFISLAEHFQDQDDEEKAEQLYLIAAYLEPSNPHSWVKVAEFATKRREFRLAASCYTKAIRAQPCIDYHLNRCNLYEKLGDQKRALRGYESLINVLGPDDDKFGLELARGIARIYLNENKIESSIRAMEGAVLKYSNQLVDEDIEQLCKSYNLTKNYLKTIDIITSLCQVIIKIDEDDDWNCDTMTILIETNEQLPKLKISLKNVNRYFTLKIRCLLLVALISLGYYDATIEDLSSTLEDADVIQHRDSLYEIAQAYYTQKVYKRSKEILYKLTGQRDSQVASIWLLYSQCLKNLNEIDEAIGGYKRVIDLNPEDFSSRLALSNLLDVQGRIEEALEVARQPLLADKPVDIPLLYQSCKLLEQMKQWSEYCSSAKALLLTDMNYTQHPKEIMCMITSKSLKTRIDNLRTVQRDLNIDQPLKQKYVGDKLDPSTLMKTFLMYTHILFHVQKDFQELKRICFSAYTSQSFEYHESSVDFYTAMACVCSKDTEFTYNHLKVLASHNTDNHQAWNLFSLAMCNIYNDLRHSRFCIRLIVKNPDAIPLAMINGHNALMSGSYKHALGEYMSVFRETPSDAFVAFCVTLTFLSLSCQRYVSSKYLCLFQMIAFMQTYLELRGTCQETMYNIARAFHQINMLDKAVIFYKKVLSMDGRHNIERSHESQEEFDEIFCLRREAAFNLALIYKNSQSHRLAYQVIKDYFTI